MSEEHQKDLHITPCWPSMVIVGEAPSRTSDSARPIVGGRSGAWLAYLMGTTVEVMTFAFRMKNLLAAYPGPTFPALAARHAASKLLPTLGEQTVMLLGANVSRAFEVPKDQRVLEWFTHSSRRMIVVPHPSGLNRWWNRPENRMKAADVLAGIAPPRAAVDARIEMAAASKKTVVSLGGARLLRGAHGTMRSSFEETVRLIDGPTP